MKTKEEVAKKRFALLVIILALENELRYVISDRLEFLADLRDLELAQCEHSLTNAVSDYYDKASAKLKELYEEYYKVYPELWDDKDE